MVKKISLPPVAFRAIVKPETLSREKNTVDVTFSTGAKVLRASWFEGKYYEELEMKPSAVRLERFRSGAPVLKDHITNLESMIGVVQKASVKNGEGVATVQFSKRAEAQTVLDDVEDGVIRNISVGYIRHKVKLMAKQDPEDKEELSVYRVVDWEPLEISFLPVQADVGAQVRSGIEEKYNCEIIDEITTSKETRTMSDKPTTKEEPKTVTEPVNVPAPTVDTAAIRAQAVTDERTRTVEIRAAVTASKLGATVGDEMITRGLSADDARKEIIKLIGEKDAKTETSSVTVNEDNDVKGLRDGIELAMMNRINEKKYALDDNARKFRFVRMLDMISELAEVKGNSMRGLSSMQIATRGLHTGSDFPELLANVANKTLRDAYQESPQTFSSIVNTTEVPDFKQVSRTQLGDAPQLVEKKENGEYKYGTMSEAAEKYAVKTYGRTVGFSREMLINDDLNAFSRMILMFGRAAANLESDLVWAIITSNPNMADGNALFSSAHGNLAGSGAVPSIITLGAAREAMRLQTSLDGNHLNLRPSQLAVPAALETVADQLTTGITPAQSDKVNPFGPGGKTPLTSFAEPRLDDNSSTAWYLFSDIMAVDIIELAYLMGERQPVIDSMIDFDTDGLKIKARHTVGAKAIDWRGAYKNAGV